MAWKERGEGEATSEVAREEREEEVLLEEREVPRRFWE